MSDIQGYKCRHFKIYELVPDHIYKKYGEAAWRFLDPLALIMLDKLRDKFGSMTINSYKWNGNRSWSGWRTPQSEWFSETSMHSLCRAFDVIFKDHTAEDVREYVISHQDEFPFIKGIEKGVSWFHFDTRNELNLIVFSA